MVTADEVPSLRVVDLKAELKARNLPIAGLKAALVERLTEALKAGGSPEGRGAEEAAPADDADEAQPAAEPAADATADVATATAAPEPAADEPAAEGQTTDEPAAEEPAGSKPAEGFPPDSEPAAAEPQPAAEEPASTVEGAQPGEVIVEGDQPDDSRVAEVEPSAVSLTAGEAAAANQSPADDSVQQAAAVKPPAVSSSAAPAPEPEPASEPPAARPSPKPALQPVVAVAVDAAAADAAEPMLEDEAPEMDFDVEPEEEPAKPTEEVKASRKGSTGKRERDPIPGFKSPPQVDTSRRDSSDARPSKTQRSEAGRTPTGRQSSQTDVPLLTPMANSGVKVPAPNMTPTPALRIDGFMRPFNLQQVKALLSQRDAVIREEEGFWLSNIKTHCYVIYETAEQAEAIRQATFNIRWPRDSNKRLAPKFVTVEEAEGVITGTGSGTPRASATPAAAAAPAAEPAESPRGTDARTDILERRQQRSVKRAAAPPPPEPTLDDLFRKTETTPHLYWLPVSKAASSAAGKPAAEAGQPVANGI